MLWDDYRYFLAVARHRTFRAAGRLLRVDQATVGRRIAALESRLGTKLFEKRSDGFFLSAAGARILENVAEIERAMFGIDQAVVGKDERIEGVVRIALPASLANLAILPNCGELFASHPKLELHFLTGAEVVNLARREADLALRLVRPSQRDLKIKRVADLTLALYGRKGAKPTAIAAFVGLHPEVMSRAEASFVQELSFTPKIRVGGWESVRAAVTAGLGVGVLPTFIGDQSPGLARVGKQTAETPLWLVAHPEVAKSAKVRAVSAELERILKP